MIDKNLWREAGRDKIYLAGVMLFGAGGGGLALAQAWLLAAVVRLVFLDGGGALETRSFFLWLAGIVALRALGAWLEEWCALRLARGVQFRLRETMLAHMEKIGPVRLREEQTGELLHLVTEGLEVLHAYFGKYLPQLFKTGILPVLFLAVIFPRDWLTGLILLITAPLLPMFMILIGKWAGSETKKQWRVMARMTGYFQDLLQGITTLKMLGQSAKQAEKVADISEDFRRASLKVLRIAFLSALTLELFSTLSIAIVAVALGLRLVGGSIDFQTAFFLLLLAPEFYLPIRSLGVQYHASLNGVAAAERIFAFLRTPGEKERAGGLVPETAAGVKVEFADVRLDYGEEREGAV
ncbi:MAG: thiol reductant ABC exporter subunit CydD, partial [Gracilibacteraceae bacterium]|nr:thiol reductant ABC exporter subunit CydD [Gracilibacteraceae bacterium]